ncbi:MAG: hypothetical protein GX685_10275 [Clostridiales bacterium]|nr:hypothetical protein [Clostridiales bacterium]
MTGYIISDGSVPLQCSHHFAVTQYADAVFVIEGISQILPGTVTMMIAIPEIG